MLGVPVERRLMTNQYAMSGTGMVSNRYMRLMAHIPLLLLDGPRDAALIAFGVGNTARAIATHPVNHVDVIDISRDMFRVAPYFSLVNHDVLNDRRVEIHINDGRNFLLGTRRTYDLISFEPPPPGQADVVGLYTREYYELVRSRLTPEGMMTQWLPIIQTGYRTNLSMLRSAVEAFPYVSLWTGAFGELIICGALKPPGLDIAAVERRITDRGLEAELREIGVNGAEGLLATYLGDRLWLTGLTGSTPAVTDDNRLLEYDYARKATDPSNLRDYFTFFQSNQYTPGLDRRVQADVRQFCIWQLQRLMGTLRDPDFLERLLVMTRKLHNLYLADAVFGLPWPAQEGILDSDCGDVLLQDRDTLIRAIWHYAVRREFSSAARVAQAGLERWPGDREFNGLKTAILGLSRKQW